MTPLTSAADIGVKLDLAPGVQGDVDGIGITDEFRSLGGKIELNVYLPGRCHRADAPVGRRHGWLASSPG